MPTKLYRLNKNLLTKPYYGRNGNRTSTYHFENFTPESLVVNITGVHGLLKAHDRKLGSID